jgi:hypothetical protein
MSPSPIIKTLGVFLLVALTACSHAARKVDCDRHLTPINPPNAVNAQAAKNP